MSRLQTKRIPEMSLSDRQRFHRMYRRGGDDECWPWQAAKSNFGHGRFKIGGRLYSPHRIAYTLARGSIGPIGPQLVLHKCDNPACCNPRHLYLGKSVNNVADMMERGRLEIPHHPRLISATPPEIVEAIRSANGSRRSISAEFGVSERLVRRAKGWPV